MARANFSDLLRLLEQDGAAYDEARRKIISNSVRFWDQVVETARTHHDPVVRAKLIGIITNARKIPLPQRRAVLEELLRNETHEIPIRSLKFILNYSLR